MAACAQEAARGADSAAEELWLAIRSMLSAAAALLTVREDVKDCCVCASYLALSGRVLTTARRLARPWSRAGFHRWHADAPQELGRPRAPDAPWVRPTRQTGATL